MQEAIITLRDIQQALQLIGELPTKRVEYDWGWIVFDGCGQPKEIGLNKEEFNKIREFSQIGLNNKIGEIATLYGYPVVVSR